MNRFILTGVIRNIKYLPDSVVVYVDDMEKGYVTSGGIQVDDMFYTWKVIFKANPFKAFINKFFNDGMLVDIDAKMRPYCIKGETVTDGYSCIGISIQRSCYIKATARVEQKMIKDTADDNGEKPDIDAYNQPDF